MLRSRQSSRRWAVAPSEGGCGVVASARLRSYRWLAGLLPSYRAVRPDLDTPVRRPPAEPEGRLFAAAPMVGAHTGASQSMAVKKYQGGFGATRRE